MGQKVHPIGLRIGIIKPWLSNWFATKEYADFLAEDNQIRKYIKKKLYSSGISRIGIDRKAQQVNINIVAAKPGIIVGRGGQGIDELRKELSSRVKKRVQIDVVEVARIDGDAQLVAEAIAQQLEKRVVFRRAMKQAIQRAMRSGVLGIKVSVSGRLGGAEIARTEWSKEGRIPLQTLRADVDYGFTEADTVMGIIGVKVWIFKGEILPGEVADQNIKAKTAGAEGGAAAPGGRGPRRRGRGPKS
ncbi:MAG: 30S ribosomal protein S3 [Candidatus Melainabacteria bacterium GWF2_32_7]|nr:MAG: 30S ribosomal protein S3 [Candidatus Melainabacteria bacterium GWF2_32_7]